MYNFTDIYPRQKHGSAKWDEMYAVCAQPKEQVIPLSVADMEFATPPEIIEGLREFVLENPVLGYSEATDAYYDAVQGWMRRRHQWEIEREWIVPTPGIVPALYPAIRAFTDEGDGVIIMPPVYYPFRFSAERCGRVVVDNPLRFNGKSNRYEIDFADLEEKAKDPKNKLLIFCSPHNPVGRVWTKEELSEVARICLENDVLVVSDEIHFDLVLPGYQHTVFSRANEAVADRCIICTAPSKTFNIAGVQVSNVIIRNETLRRQFRLQMESTGMGGLNYFAYKSCEIAYNQCEGWAEEMLRHIEENRQLVETYVKERIPELSVMPMEGTYLLWIDCRRLGMNAEELEAFMQKAQLFLDEGYIFGQGGAGFERINLACPARYIQAALERLEAAVASLR